MYWDLFWELSTERLVESGPIPGSKIIEYSRSLDLHYDDLKSVIRSMDNTYLEYLQEERDKATSKTPSSPNTGNKGRRAKG